MRSRTELDDICDEMTTHGRQRQYAWRINPAWLRIVQIYYSGVQRR